jgi:hypothetical protein
MDSNSELNDLASGLRGIRCGTDAQYLGRKGGKENIFFQISHYVRESPNNIKEEYKNKNT